MGRFARGVRTGTGPYEGSYRRRVEGRGIGRRRARGEVCPVAGSTSLNDIRPARRPRTNLMDMKPMAGSIRVGLRRRANLSKPRKGMATTKDMGWENPLR